VTVNLKSPWDQNCRTLTDIRESLKWSSAYSFLALFGERISTGGSIDALVIGPTEFNQRTLSEFGRRDFLWIGESRYSLICRR